MNDSKASSNQARLDDMEIYPVNVEEDDKNNSISHRNFDVLLKPPFNAILYGSSQTGKTTGLVNIITRQGKEGGMYGPDSKARVFDDIIMISSTLMSDDVIKPVLDLTTATYDYYEDDLIRGIVELQRQRKERGERKGVGETRCRNQPERSGRLRLIQRHHRGSGQRHYQGRRRCRKP